MPDYDYDLVILGGGSAGLTAAKVARFFRRKRVALVDKQRLGGDCLYYGCVPSKSLIKAARVAHEVRTAGRFGLAFQQAQPALETVNRRVHVAIDEVGKLDSADSLRAAGVEVVLGGESGGHFTSPHVVQVGDTALSTKYVLIATGSRPARLATPGLKDAGYLTNEDVFDLQNLPERLAVIGGGPIGCELAQAFARLGAHVTVLQRGPHLIPRDDPDAIAILEQAFADEGIEVRYNSGPVSARREGAEKVLTIEGKDAGELRVDEILVATGRTPNIEGLNLQAAGVRASARGIAVNGLLQTSQKHIYATGDVVGGLQFTHFAGYQAAQAVRNIFLPLKLKFKPGVVPWVTFTDPEVAHAGLTEEEASRAGKPFSVVRFPYSSVERAVTDQDPCGQMKFLIDSKRCFVGCHITGANAGELINELTLAMNKKLTVDDVIGSIHAYPTYSFGMPVALYDYVLTEHPVAAARFGRWLSRFT